MPGTSPITETTLQNDKLIHLRNIPCCIQPFINSFKSTPNISCKCADHILVKQVNEEEGRPIKILSTANLLTFIEYDLSNFILPLSSLELLKEVNIYAYNSIKTTINLHNLCVMPDIFFKGLYDIDLKTNYNNTVGFLNEIFSQPRELLDMEFPPKETNVSYKNIIESTDLHKFLTNEIMEIKNLSKTKEISLDLSHNEQLLIDLCYGVSSNRNDKTFTTYQSPQTNIQEENHGEYKFVNLFKIPFLNTDKLLCINIEHFNQLKFKCGIHNNHLFINEKVISEFTDKKSIKVFIPLKVVFRENNLLFTEVLDINEDLGKILLKRVSSGDRVLCDLDYSNIHFDIPLNGLLGVDNEEMEYQERKASCCSEKEHLHNEEDITDEETDVEEDSEIQINPIVRLPDNLDLRNPLNLHLNCFITLEDTLLHGKVVEIMQEKNPYDILLLDLKIEKEIFKYKTELNFNVPDHDEYVSNPPTTSATSTDYFKNLNKNNPQNNTNLINNAHLLTVTIDPIGCTDIDDAISLNRLQTSEELLAKLTDTLKVLKRGSINTGSLNLIEGYSKTQTLLLLNSGDAIQTVNKAYIDKQVTEGVFYEIYIHIADCSAFITEKSELDFSASIKATSFYYTTATETSKRIDMLPTILSSNLISLRAGLLRRALTVKILVYRHPGSFLIIDYKFINDTIINKCKLSYEAAELIIKNNYTCKGCSSPSLPGETDKCVECIQKEFKLNSHYTMKDVKESLNVLINFTEELKRHRGPSVLESILGLEKKDIDPLEEGPFNRNNQESNDTHSLVEELMLLANQLAAIHIYTTQPSQTILRIHKPTDLYVDEFANMPPETLKRQAMKRMNQAKYRDTGHLLLSRDRSPIQAHVHMFVGNIGPENTSDKKKIKHTKQSTHIDSPFYHFGLNIPIYTHFTSPIRRYADLLVHRLIKNSLFAQTGEKENVRKEVINNLNKQTMKSKILNRVSKQICFVEGVVGNSLGDTTNDKNSVPEEDDHINYGDISKEDDKDAIKEPITDDMNKIYEGIVEKEEVKIFSLSCLNESFNNEACFYMKVYLPEEEIEGYISKRDNALFNAFSTVKLKVDKFKGNEILFNSVI